MIAAAKGRAVGKNMTAHTEAPSNVYRVNACRMMRALALASLSLLQAPTSFGQAANKEVIAVDVLLQVDDATLEKAKAANERLRKAYPQGYSLDSAHTPHITLVQRFVRASDLEAVSAAVARVLETSRLSNLDIRISKYMTAPWGQVSIAAFLVDSTPALRSFEQKIVDAVQPFAIKGGTADAFALAAGESTIDTQTISWVENFVPASSGRNYVPHITLGVAAKESVEALKAEPFDAFTFKPREIAIYQLGNLGTAQKKLWAENPPQRPATTIPTH